MRSALPMERQKHPQIAFGDPDDSADAMHGEMAALDPPADRSRGDTETFCDVGDCEKVDFILAVAPRRRGAEIYGTGRYEAARHAWRCDQRLGTFINRLELAPCAGAGVRANRPTGGTLR
jgi:hypothetical protein